jgi:hypothetical protein
MGAVMARNPIRSLICTLALLGALPVLSVAPARAQPDTSRFELIWFFATMTRGGPVATRAPERTSFGNESDCAAFGKRMTPRMEDWVRGLVRADWDHPVGVRFQCNPAGSPT